MKKFNARWQLVIYDILILFVVDLLQCCSPFTVTRSYRIYTCFPITL